MRLAFRRELSVCGMCIFDMCIDLQIEIKLILHRQKNMQCRNRGWFSIPQIGTKTLG